jgi:hypothetical protein
MGKATPTALILNPASGEVVVTHPTREQFVSRLMGAIPRAPHLADLATAIPAGLAFAILPERAFFPFLRHDFRRPFLLVVGDDVGPLAKGPEGFHRASVRKALAAAVFVGIVPGAARREFYGRAIRTALEARRMAVLIETQRHELGAWSKLATRHAKVPVEIDGESEGRA